MLVNKLLPPVQSSLKAVRGTAKERKQKALNLTENFTKQLLKKIKDDYTVITYSQLVKDIKQILPGEFDVSIKSVSSADKASYDGLCTAVYDKDNNIKSISLEIEGISDTIRAYHLPVFIHEFQHLADDIFNPKYLSRSQKLIKKGLENDAYNAFYDDYYYCEEFAKSRKKKHYVLKLVKRKTEEFLKSMTIEDKLDCLQDIRYCLASEINAYRVQRKVAALLKSKGMKTNPYNSENYPHYGLFEEKIKLIGKLIKDYIKQEREINKTAS